MAFFFDNFPKVNYDIRGNGKTVLVQNPLLRFKLKEILKSRASLFYSHSIQDGQSAQFIAKQYYGDESLEWILYFINEIIDPLYDWPLDYQNLLNFVKNKYGSVPAAQAQIVKYEWIIQEQTTDFDGTIIPKVVLEVDQTTYSSLPVADRRAVDAFTYETELNDSKREIKILHREFLPQFLSEAESIFD